MCITKHAYLTIALRVNYLLTIELYTGMKMINTNSSLEMLFIQHIEEIV